MDAEAGDPRPARPRRATGEEDDRSDGTNETNGRESSEEPWPAPELRPAVAEAGEPHSVHTGELVAAEQKMRENAGDLVQRKCNESATNGQAGGDGMGGVGRPAPIAGAVPPTPTLPHQGGRESKGRGKTVAEVAREMADPRWWSTVYVERW